MRFSEAGLAGAWVIDIEPLADERGLFARTFCSDEFRSHGLPAMFVQSSTSYNRRRGTLRGLHYQAAPHAEDKLVRCTRGALYDVIVDLRRGEAGFGQWRGFELNAENRRALFIPAGFAHGFQSLADDTEILYQMTTPYAPGASRGVRWDDPEIAIRWPLPATVISAADGALPFLAGVGNS